MNDIVIATIKEWNISNYFKLKQLYKNDFNFHLLTNKDELTEEYINKLNPKYIFFPHWSWIIPKEIYNNFDCVVFHMTDLPYGRGGSPMQNLIVREVYDTKISALKVDDGMDTGDIYLKEDFNVSLGSAEENFMKLSNIVFNKMIPKFLTSNLIPTKQVGDIVNFKRRIPAESNINILKDKSLNKLYDFIRMLDAEGYPKAYLKLDDIRLEFSEVNLKNNTLVGRFEVTENE
ncbi:MAG: methionyl-tRNA formyltransferase [Epsilonproteobacteria bacterium]|nr:MAG: methionyl-tRNA formyltransferase [Campylobacterota bacterium]